MRNIKSIRIALAIIIFFQLLDSCNDTINGPQEVYHYTFNNIQVQNIDNAGKTPVIVENENEIISKEAYGIRMLLNLERLFDSVVDVANNSFIKNISLFNNLYAMRCDDDPLPPPLSLQDTIVYIKVFTLNDFDNEFMAGSDVSDLFKIYDSSKFQYITIDEYVGKYEETIKIYKDENNIESEVFLYLMKPPIFIGEHSFRVEVSLSDGRMLLATTVKINLE
jgi:hypothetical protein